MSHLWEDLTLPCVIEKRGLNFTSFSDFQKRALDSFPITVAAANSPFRPIRCQNNSPVFFLPPSRWVNQKYFAIRYPVIRISNRYSSICERLLYQKSFLQYVYISRYRYTCMHIYIYIYIHIGLVDRVFANGPEDRGSTSGQFMGNCT